MPSSVASFSACPRTTTVCVRWRQVNSPIADCGFRIAEWKAKAQGKPRLAGGRRRPRGKRQRREPGIGNWEPGWNKDCVRNGIAALDIGRFFAVHVPRVARQPVLTAILFPYGVHPLFPGHWTLSVRCWTFAVSSPFTCQGLLANPC